MCKLNRIIAAALIFANAAAFCLPLRAQVKKSSSKQTPSVFENPSLVKKYQQLITPENLAARLYFLASDFFEGRETGTRGQRLAAEYLASQYQLMGLAPKSNNQAKKLSPAAYFQKFMVYPRNAERNAAGNFGERQQNRFDHVFGGIERRFILFFIRRRKKRERRRGFRRLRHRRR